MHNTPCSEVRVVYKIVNTTANLAKYEQYLSSQLSSPILSPSDRVETKHNFASQNKTLGDERCRRHGTTRKYRAGDEGVTALCSSSSCSPCCIKSSFNISFFGMKTGWGGGGVRGRDLHNCNFVKFVQYLSSVLGLLSNSFGRSDGYLRNRCTSDWKAMLLNTVVVGKGYKTTLIKPPTGYDSEYRHSVIFRQGTDEEKGPGRSRRSIELRRARGA